MSLRLINISLNQGHVDTIRAVAEQFEATDFHEYPSAEDGGAQVSFLAAPGDRQNILDAVQKALAGSTDWRIVILPVEAAIPNPEHGEKQSKEGPSTGVESREELYNDISAGARVNLNFVVLAVLVSLIVRRAG